MSLFKARDCPICGDRPVGTSFPYATFFKGTNFAYLRCGGCKTVYVDPVPNSVIFASMYTKSTYHDQFYDDGESDNYSKSVSLLMQHLEPGSTILDYGCGLGMFLKVCGLNGLVSFGVEFDFEAARFAAKHANCEVMTVETFNLMDKSVKYDAIHMGDVLEHLPDPERTLSLLLNYLKPGGVLFVEGPLEANSSPVFWAVRIFGMLKRFLKPKFIANDPPTHLFRTNWYAQRTFFARFEKNLNILYWEVDETGWPYKAGGFIKQSISACATFLGGRKFAGITFGNRFKAILLKI